MFFRRMLCALLVWMVLGSCRLSWAQSDRVADLPAAAAAAVEPEPAPASAPDLKNQIQPGQKTLDADAQAQLRLAEARRLWQDVRAKRRAGQSQEARASYVLYLKAAYLVNENPWLLLELGRTLEQLGESEDALKAYKRYLIGRSEQKDTPENRREAERAVERLSNTPKQKWESPSQHGPRPSQGLKTAGLIVLPIGLLFGGLSLSSLLSAQPPSTFCNIGDTRSNCLNETIGREFSKAFLTGTTIIGGLAVVTGTILLATGTYISTPPQTSRAIAVSLTPNISPNTVGLLATGQF